MHVSLLGHDFQWMNEPRVWRLDEGVLGVDAEPGTNFFIDQAYAGVSDNAHFLATPLCADFMLRCRVSVEMHATWDSVCLMLMRDATHWAKLCYENWPTGPSIVSVVTRDYSDDCAGPVVGPCQPWLCIVRSGSNVGFHFSLDGSQWAMARYFNLPATDALRVGFAFQSPVGEGCRIAIRDLVLTTEAQASAREVVQPAAAR